MSTAFLTGATWNDLGIGALLGKVGFELYSGWRGGSLGITPPTQWVTDLQARPMKSILPYVGGLLAYTYFVDQAMGARMGIGLVGGVIGGMVAPSLGADSV